MNLKKTAFRVGIEHIISGAAASVLYRSCLRGSNPLDFIPEPAPAETKFRVGAEAQDPDGVLISASCCSVLPNPSQYTYHCSGV